MIRRIHVALATLLAVCSLTSYGQEFRSTISGRVTDAQQALVPNVKIVCVSTQTGAKYETVSSADGSFAVPFIPPGPYTVTAKAAGFKAYVRTGVRVTTNERMQLDIGLEVGVVAETVTVTSEAPALE